MNETIAYLPGLSPVENKKLCARFDGGRLSSDGGVLLLRGIEKRLGLTARLGPLLIARFSACGRRKPRNEAGGYSTISKSWASTFS